MIKLLGTAAYLLCTAFTAPVMAQDFDKGMEAAQAGDYVTALEEWRPLAEQGDAAAQVHLGILYKRGRGVLQDYAEAADWYRKAAEQGNSGAQTFLGFMYENGRGVPQDAVLAHIWYNIGGANGNDFGLESRGKIEQRMTREQVADAQSRARLCIASNYQDCD